MKKNIVFNNNLKLLHKNNNLIINKNYDYIKNAIADQIVDRICDLNDKEFINVADIGAHDGCIRHSLIRRRIETEGFPNIKNITQIESSKKLYDKIINNNNIDKILYNNDIINNENIYVNNKNNYLINDIEYNDMNPKILKNNEYDLIVSSLNMHWINNIPNFLKQIYNSLKPESCFIASMYGGDTLFELRASLAAGEHEREGGLSPHISPTIPAADACILLQKANFKLVTVDVANIVIEFDNAFKLMEELGYMGESNSSLSKRDFVRKDTFLAAASIYDELFGQYDQELNKKFIPATFEIIFLIGWKEPAVVPLERGDYESNLKDVLTTDN